jgi:hypothetical protein
VRVFGYNGATNPNYTMTIDVPAGGFSSVVTDRRVFYNNSAFDGNTPGASASDFSAIAPDKSAYVPDKGGLSPANMTSYSKGINGVMVELTGLHGPIDEGDFTFRMSDSLGSANNAPSTWSAAPTPSVTVFSDVPVAGTDRVALVWADGAIADRYLQVVVEGNDAAGGFNINTGLPISDVFYFGNKIGDDFGGYAGFYNTDATDEIDARGNQGVAKTTDNPYDFNKDRFVDATDQLIARNNQGFMAALTFANPAPAPVALEDAASGAAIAAALAVGQPAESPPSASPEVAPPAAAGKSSGSPRPSDLPALSSTEAARANLQGEATDEAVETWGDESLLGSLLGDLLD